MNSSDERREHPRYDIPCRLRVEMPGGEDVRTRTLYFRSKPCRNIKSISLADCDFSTNSPIQFIDLHINFKGDIIPQLAAWTPEINQAYVLAGFPAGYEQETFYRSEDWRNLQKNLLNYSEQLRHQTKSPSTTNDCLPTNKTKSNQ